MQHLFSAPQLLDVGLRFVVHLIQSIRSYRRLGLKVMDDWQSGPGAISICGGLVAGLVGGVYEGLCLALIFLLVAVFFAWRRSHLQLFAQQQSFAQQRQQLLAATADQRQLTELLQAIVEGTTDAVFVKDRQGKYLLLNEATSRFVGRPMSEILGRDDRELFAPAHAEFLMARDKTVMDANAPSTAEELLTAAGVTRTYLAVKAPYRNSQGQVVGLVGVSRDITERKRIEHDLRQALKMEAVGRLAGGIAHDFNNLLTVIKGYCELLLQAPGDQNLPAVNWRESICEIRDAGDRAARLTGQLLAFSRRAILQPRPLSLNQSITEIEPLFSRLIGDRISLAMELNEALPQIVADPTQIEQLLVNLVINARDAMPAGGRIIIATRQRTFECEQVYVDRLVQPGQYVELTISDSGRGIAPELRAKIFEPFFSTRSGRNGPGLGLSVVQAVVAQCDGYVGFECPDSGGTVFSVLLPVKTQATSTCTMPVVTELAKDLTILVVEDDPAVQTIICNLLRSQGYRVLLASSGNEALEKANTEGYGIDLLLTDVVMPGMSGRELADTLRHQWPDMRILFMSGYTDDAVLRSGINQQDDFVGKPFTMDSLRTKVLEALSRA